MSTLGRHASLTPQDYCQPQCPEGIKKGEGDGGRHAEQSPIARQSLAAPGQYVCSEEPDDYPDQREGAADYRNHARSECQQLACEGETDDNVEQHCQDPRNSYDSAWSRALVNAM